MQPIFLKLSTQEILVQFQDYFHQYDIFQSFLRILAWGITKFLKFLSEGMESFVDKAYKLINFTTSSNVNSFLTKLGPLLYISFAIGIVGLGVHLIFGNNRSNKIVTNLLLAVLVTSSLPLLMKNGNDLVLTFRKAVLQEEDGQTSTAIIKSGIADLRYMESKKFKFKKNDTQPFNNIKNTNISLININETIEPSGFRLFGTIQIDLDLTDGDGWSISFSDGGPFANYLDINEKGQRKVKEISNTGFLGIFPPAYYYRYDVQFVNIWISLIANIFVLFFSSFKVIKIIFDLAFSQIFTMFLAGTDLTNGQKLKKALENIISSYIVLLLMTMIHKFYLLGVAYINAKSWSGLVEALLILFIAIAVIDAPDIVEKVLGIDAGISKGANMITSVYYGSQMAKGTGGMIMGTKDPITEERKGGLYGMGKSILRGGIGGGLYTSGKLKGMMDEFAQKEKKNGEQKKDRSAMGAPDIIYQGGAKRESIGVSDTDINPDVEQPKEPMKKENQAGKDIEEHTTSKEMEEANNKDMPGASEETGTAEIEKLEKEQEDVLEQKETSINGAAEKEESGNSLAADISSYGVKEEAGTENLHPDIESDSSGLEQPQKGDLKDSLRKPMDMEKEENNMTSRDILGEKNLDSNHDFNQKKGHDNLKDLLGSEFVFDDSDTAFKNAIDQGMKNPEDWMYMESDLSRGVDRFKHGVTREYKEYPRGDIYKNTDSIHEDSGKKEKDSNDEYWDNFFGRESEKTSSLGESIGSGQIEEEKLDQEETDSYRKYFSDMAKESKIGKKAKGIHEKGYVEGTKAAQKMKKNIGRLKNIRNQKKGEE